MENLVPKSPFAEVKGSGPTMIYHGDDIKQRLTSLNRLTSFDPIKIEQDILLSHARLATLPELSTNQSTDTSAHERQSRIQQFVQYCADDDLLPSGSLTVAEANHT